MLRRWARSQHIIVALWCAILCLTLGLTFGINPDTGFTAGIPLLVYCTYWLIVVTLEE